VTTRKKERKKEGKPMANQKHLDKLDEGVEAWNAWRAANPSIVPDLSEAMLNDYEIDQINFSGADLSYVSFIDADLNYANLRNANLTDADVEMTSFKRADFTGANVSGVDFSRANTEGAIGLNQKVSR
jgi:uncharacterized protein YjbI with pentapeptide repeats